MSVDLDHLLRDGGGQPDAPTDADAIWRQGRQRRRRRLVGASVSGIAVVALLAVVPLTGGADLRPVIDPMAQEGSTGEEAGPDEGAAGTADAVEATEEPEQDTDGPALSAERQAELEELTRLEVERIRQVVDAVRQRMEQLIEEAEQAEAEPGEADGSGGAVPPMPNQARMTDPCAVHEGGEMRAFIDVVSPVDGQQVDGEIDLVGCASVYEGTLQYRVLNPAGDVLLADFTTATAGGPQIGEFRETITVPGGGQARYLEVYWEDVASGPEQHPDGPERDLVRVTLEGS